jgi:hypothetical protein
MKQSSRENYWSAVLGDFRQSGLTNAERHRGLVRPGPSPPVMTDPFPAPRVGLDARIGDGRAEEAGFIVRARRRVLTAETCR